MSIGAGFKMGTRRVSHVQMALILSDNALATSTQSRIRVFHPILPTARDVKAAMST